MTAVHVECEDPEVLAEHERRHLQGAVQVGYPATAEQVWVDRVQTDDPEEVPLPETWAVWISNGWRFRLTFSDASAAGQGLVDYRDRLGAVVEHRFGGEGWRSSGAADALGVERLIRHGEEYRIVAPVDPGPASGASTPTARPARYEGGRELARVALAAVPDPQPDPPANPHADLRDAGMASWANAWDEGYAAGLAAGGAVAVPADRPAPQITDEMVERAAEAICDTTTGEVPWATLGEMCARRPGGSAGYTQDLYRAKARAALRAALGDPRPAAPAVVAALDEALTAMQPLTDADAPYNAAVWEANAALLTARAAALGASQPAAEGPDPGPAEEGR